MEQVRSSPTGEGISKIPSTTLDHLFSFEFLFSDTNSSFLLAVVTNALLLLDCELWKVESLLFDGSLGLFHWQVPGQHDECVEIASSDVEELDFYQGQILLCARWSAVAALGLGGCMTLIILFQQCLIPCPCSALLRDICAIGTQICLGLVYTTYFSRICTDFECHYGQGTLYLIITQSLWAVAGVLSLCMRPGRHERSKNRSQEGVVPAANDSRDKATAQQEQEEATTLEAGLAKYPKESNPDEDGAQSETSSMVVGMSVNPEEEDANNKSILKLEQTTGMEAIQENEPASSETPREVHKI